MRYQNFVLRFMEPVDLFKNLVIALYRQIIVRYGVNVFLRRWWNGDELLVAHADVQILSCALSKCGTRCTLETNSWIGITEDLTWHIGAALYAEPNRIGHGQTIRWKIL
jgi:adenosine deaminase/adenosine deaminase CECR1